MPEPLKASHIDSKTDPTVDNQWDHDTPKKQQIEEFYKTVDGQKIGLLATLRPDIGPVSRSMAVAKRQGPDFLFLANKHSTKFSDISANPTAQLTFQNSSNQDWVSVSGTVTTASNDDPRIKDLYSKPTSAWFGDLGDGVHTGGPEDPRMALIELKAKYISYWKAQVGTLGFLKEVGQATLTGQVADTGVQRELVEEDIEAMRKTQG